MKVAVVGSGVSGLAATWPLSEYSDHTVDLYEADSRPGGQANTVKYSPPGKPDESVDVDTGFVVFNPTTHPNFLRFLQLHESTRDLVVPTEMTFSVSRDRGEFEWAGKNLLTMFCQPQNLLNSDMWNLLYDVVRFNTTAMHRHDGWMYNRHDGWMYNMPTMLPETIDEYLDRKRYSAPFRDNYLIPLIASIWSTPPETCATDFHIGTLFTFLDEHDLLQIAGRPFWRTIKGGSKAYVNEILSKLDKSHLHLSTPVESLTRLEGSQILLKTSTGSFEYYDHVILACHSDDAMRILRNGEGVEGGTGITLEEEIILGAFKWSWNEVLLHSDTRLMPRNKAAWSCWNYLASDNDEVSLTYRMNELQHIDESKYGPVLITLNPPFEPKPELIAGKWRYEHPVLNNDVVRAQREMTSIQGVSGISFAGAYLRYGFHEDGFTSGLKAAVALPSVRPPFEITCANKVYECGSIGTAFLEAIFEIEHFYGRWRFVKLFSLLFVIALERYIWGGLSWSES